MATTAKCLATLTIWQLNFGVVVAEHHPQHKALRKTFVLMSIRCGGPLESDWFHFKLFPKLWFMIFCKQTNAHKNKTLKNKLVGIKYFFSFYHFLSLISSPLCISCRQSCFMNKPLKEQTDLLPSAGPIRTQKWKCAFIFLFNALYWTYIVHLVAVGWPAQNKDINLLKKIKKILWRKQQILNWSEFSGQTEPC